MNLGAVFGAPAGGAAPARLADCPVLTVRPGDSVAAGPVDARRRYIGDATTAPCRDESVSAIYLSSVPEWFQLTRMHDESCERTGIIYSGTDGLMEAGDLGCVDSGVDSLSVG